MYLFVLEMNEVFKLRCLFLTHIFFSQDHIFLTIPSEDSLVRSASEVSLPQSETWEEDSVNSLPSTADTSVPSTMDGSTTTATDSVDGTNAKDDFVNPRGVRFIPHHHHGHEGK